MSLIRRRGKKYKAIRFYDADFYNLVFGNLNKRFHEKLLFLVRQSKKFTWRISSKISPYKLRKRKRTFRSLRFLTKQQLKYFFVNIKEYQFRHLYRKILGYKRGNLNVSLLAAVVRQFEARLDSFLFKFNLAKPFNLNKVLQDKVFQLNDGNPYLKRSYLLNSGDRYSLSSLYSYKFYVKRFMLISKLRFKRKMRRRSYFFWGRRFKRLKKIPKRIHSLVFQPRFMMRRQLIKYLFSFVFIKTLFLNQFLRKMHRRFFFFKRYKKSFLLYFLAKHLYKFKKYKSAKFLKIFFKRSFVNNILKYRRVHLYKFLNKRRRRSRKLKRFFSRRVAFRPWSLFMNWRLGYLLPDPHLKLVLFLEQASKPKDMLFSFSFNIRNLLFIYQSLK